MIRKQTPETALAVVDKWLKDNKGQVRADYLQLLIPRSRLRIAMGQWEQAQQDVAEYLRRRDPKRPDRSDPDAVENYCKASLILGFLYERKGELKAAIDAWKKGYVASREHGGLGQIYPAILGSLSGEVTNEDADRMIEIATKAGFGSSMALKYVRQRMISTALVASILRNMWRTPRGRQHARGLAFAQVPIKEEFTIQVVLTGAELMRRAIQGTDDLTIELGAQQEELNWHVCEDLFREWQEGKLMETQVVQICLTWAGSNTAFGWQAVAPTLKPNLRGPLAYVFGHHYTHLKRPEDAKQFFRTAVKDAPAGSPLRRLAETALRDIEHEPSRAGRK
jgi:tetratricopeptide (TPR) repeat protein